MIPHFSRLLELWRIAAYYRLDRIIPASAQTGSSKLLLMLIRVHPASWGRSAKDPMRLKYAMEEMGPLFIKLGQLLSTRRDLIPPEFLTPLTQLQDQVKPFPVSIVRETVEEAFGQSIAQLFTRFDDIPLAAASIAQVHTASLPDGREVIVKVVRPHIRAQIVQDFEILIWLGVRLEERIEVLRALHLSEIINNYRQVILNELDLTLEAANTRQIRHNFEGSQMMYVPEVYADHPNVMVAERITGVPISDIATFDRLGMDRAQLAEKGLTIFFTQVFRDNFFHADMHPGNVFVETLNPQNPRFISLDCAIVGELSDNDRLTIARMLLAVIQSNFTQLIQIVHQAGWIAPATDQAALARDMKRVVSPMISKPMDQLDFAGILLDVMDIARRYRLEIPPQLMLLIKTLVHIEGLGRDLYPQLDIWKLAKPILTEWVKSRMNPVKTIQDFGRQLPDLLMGATDLPKLLIDSLHGLSQQRVLLDQQLHTLQQMQHSTQAARRADWLTGGGLLGLVYLAAHSGHPISDICVVLAGLLLLWRVMS